MSRYLKITFLLIGLLHLPLSVFALPTDNEQAMQIVAESTLFNYKTGLNIYEGNVTIDQGKTRVKADRVTTQKNKQNKIAEAIAYGKGRPAHYWTIPKDGDPIFHAEAKTITFYPIKSTVMLEGDVVVTQGDNSFHGPIVIYNIKDQTVWTPASKNGRATITIEPKQLKS